MGDEEYFTVLQSGVNCSIKQKLPPHCITHVWVFSVVACKHKIENCDFISIKEHFMHVFCPNEILNSLSVRGKWFLMVSFDRDCEKVDMTWHLSCELITFLECDEFLMPFWITF